MCAALLAGGRGHPQSLILAAQAPLCLGLPIAVSCHFGFQPLQERVPWALCRTQAETPGPKDVLDPYTAKGRGLLFPRSRTFNWSLPSGGGRLRCYHQSKERPQLSRLSEESNPRVPHK